MAVITEQYRTVNGNEQTLTRGFTVQAATSEHDAIDATRTFIESKTPNEVFWPPLATSDGSGDLGQATGTPPINHSKFLIDVSVEEIDLPDETRSEATATFKTAATYGYRAVCPIWDYNLSLAQVQATQSRFSQQYARAGKELIPTNGAIEPQSTGQAAKGTPVGAPQTQFHLTWNPMAIASNLDVAVLKYATEIQKYVGRTNKNVFLRDTPQGFDGFQPGELRFDGWTGKLIDQKNDLYEYRFTFSYGALLTSDGGVEHNIGGIQIPTNDTYGGWQYLWIKWEAYTAASGSEEVLLPRARQLNFETVSKEFDFYLLFTQDGKESGNKMIPSSCPGFTDFTGTYPWP